MTIPNEQRDRWFDENLRKLVNRHYGECVPKPGQTARWCDIATATRRPVLLRVGRFMREHPLGSMFTTIAAAAVIILAVVITFNASSPQISAAEVFSQLDRTLDECPVVSIEGKNLELAGHRINIRFCGSDEGKLLYGEIRTYPLKNNTDNSNNTGDKISTDLVFARNGDRGWLLIRKFGCNGYSPLDLFMERGESLLIDLPIPSGSKQAVESAFPQFVRISDIRGLVTSLQLAAPDLKIVRRNDSLTQLHGTITVPEKLSLGNLHESIDVSRVRRRIISVADGGGGGELRRGSVNDGIVDFIVEGVVRELRNTRDSLEKMLTKNRRKTLRRVLIHQLKGARITISYEPRKKLLRSITLTNIGPSRGFLKIRFYGKTFDNSLFSSQRFREDPKVRVLTKQQLLMGLVAPVTE